MATERERERERVREIYASITTWWWWWWPNREIDIEIKSNIWAHLFSLDSIFCLPECHRCFCFDGCCRSKLCQCPEFESRKTRLAFHTVLIPWEMVCTTILLLALCRRLYLSLPPTRPDLAQGQWPEGRLKEGIRGVGHEPMFEPSRTLLVIGSLSTMWAWWA